MKNLLLFLLSLFSFTIQVSGQNVVINEFMSDNETTIPDEDGDFKDWIELYNNSESTINLLDYSLSDDFNNLDKWVFPQKSIQPHDFLLIFASDKNRLDTIELHTNFKISSSGEKIFLSDNSGILIDETVSVSLSPDETYGRTPDGNTNWIKISIPSPNSSNNSANQLLFSNQEGFYTSPFYQTITSLTGDTIYYSLDGSLPDENSTIYADSIFIDYKTYAPNFFSEIPTTPEQNLITHKAWESPGIVLDKATILRCASYHNGIKTSKVYTKSFFVDDEVFSKYTIPVISLITDGDNLFNPDSGIYVPGVHYDPNNPEYTGNYFEDGDEWERPVHIEYFENNGLPGFAQDAGIRIHGGKTRHAAQKSLRLYARNEYGAKYFNYKLLPQKQTTEYKRFILRTTMGAYGGQTIFKDALAQDISKSLNIDYQNFQPVIVYLNGEYWGIHTLRDRIDDRYIEYTHHIDNDSVEFRTWNNAHYNNLIEFIESNDLSYNTNYEYVITQIDIDNYIDYTISEQFFANYDWPGNNIKLWRPISVTGKWRWVLFDLDDGFKNESRNMLIHATMNDTSIHWPNPPASTFLFRNLLKSAIFSNHFIARYAEILNQNFSVSNMMNKLDTIKKMYEPEVPDHISRWNYPDSFYRWENDIKNELIPFIKNRPCYVESNITEFFSLTEFGFSCFLNTDDTITENSLIVASNPNNGNFYIYSNSSDINNAQVTITNINGKNVFNESIVSLTKYKHKHFNLNHLPSNIYILQVVSNDFHSQTKIIIIN